MPEPEMIYYALRWVSAALSVAGLLGLLRHRRWWMRLVAPIPTTWIVLALVCVVIGWASITGAIQCRPAGLYVGLATITTGLLVIVAWWPEPGRRQRHVVAEHKGWRRLRRET